MIAILAAIAVPNIMGYIGRGKERSWDADQKIIEVSAKAYQAEENYYPVFEPTVLGKPTWNVTAFDADKGAIDMAELIGAEGYLDETPASASSTNGGTGSYTWYVDTDKKVKSCGPGATDTDFVDGIYP